MELKLRILKGSNQKFWITSDSHYGHKNICRGVTTWRTKDDKIPISQTRDFKTIEEMNDTIVNNINNVVGQDDILIHDGDWSFGGIENIWRFRSRIICKNVYIILGNHDHHILRDRLLTNCHFDEFDNIVDGPIPNGYEDGRDEMFGVTARQLFVGVFERLYLSVTDENTFRKTRIVFDHFPIESWENLSQGVLHIHGHLHLPHEKKFRIGRKMDGGIDGHPEFRPYELFEECVKPLSKRKIDSEINRLDHHTEEFK